MLIVQLIDQIEGDRPPEFNRPCKNMEIKLSDPRSTRTRRDLMALLVWDIGTKARSSKPRRAIPPMP